ncbi:hypothetical protein ACKKBG_A15560 [Auxenochlorella protothecoides x Auxenochlorella symbiontica]
MGEEKPYTPRNILVTGGAGFIGSHVVVRLVQRYPQYRVVVFDCLDYCATLHNLQAVKDAPNFKFIKGDIKSGDLLYYVMETEKIDTVMHFAAQTHVDHSFGNSVSFTINNMYGTHVLLEAARRYGQVHRFINVSTDEVYGETSFGLAAGLVEKSRLEPTNPYAAAKAGAEIMALAYYTSYQLPVIITRGNNVYGPGQFPEKLIPKFILLAASDRPLTVYGAGEAVRSYLYIADVAAAYDAVLHCGLVGEVYNIGSVRERSVLEVAHDIGAAFGRQAPLLEHVRDRAFNDRRYFINNDKLAALGWEESTSWEQGLRKTIDWYLNLPSPAEYWDNGNVDAALQPHAGLNRQRRVVPLEGQNGF